MEFAYPWVLAALPLLALAGILKIRAARRKGFAVPAAAGFADLPVSWRVRLRYLPLILQFSALLLLLIAAARPREGRERVVEHREGIAVEMVLDRSGSMGEDFAFRGRGGNRLAAAKQIFLDFALGGNGLPGRVSDLIGMITFARYADTVCPLTLAHEALPTCLEQIELVNERSEDGTALGDALALAAARLYNAEKELKPAPPGGKDNYSIKSKVIILLTDGIDNCSRTPPDAAAAMCEKWGIKIYAVAIGGGNRGIFGFPFVNLPAGGAEVDSELLTRLARTTGGKFFMAADGKSLQAVYQAIDTLEKSALEAERYTDYAERFAGFAWAGLLCLGLSLLLRFTVLRINS